MSVLALATTQVAATPVATTLPVWNDIPFHPGVSSLEDFLGKSAKILDDAIPANISGTNVYYYSYNDTNTVTQYIVSNVPSTSVTFPLNGNDNSTLRLKSYLNLLNNSLSTIYTNLDVMRAGLINSFTPSNTASWTFAAWKVKIIKEWYAIEKTVNNSVDLTNVTIFQSFVNNIDTILSAKGLGAYGSFSIMTPGMVMEVTNQLILPVQSFTSLLEAYQAQTKIHDVQSLMIYNVINWAQPIVEAANVEIKTKTSLTLNFSVNMDLTETINVEDLAVIVLWDNDNSLMRFISDLKAHPLQNPGFQPFSGDEVFYLMHFTTESEHYTGYLYKTMSWYYNGSTSNKPTALGNFIRMMAVSPEIAQLLGRAAGDNRLALIRELYFGNISAPSVDKTFHESSFDLSQLRVNKLDLAYSGSTGITAKDVDLWFAEHKWAGLVAFNDTNHDGIMNLGVNGTYPFLYPVSSEAQYRFDITGVGSRDFEMPTVVNNGINFGITFNNITGSFVPYDVDTDTAQFNKTVTGALNETVPKMGFNFRFTTNITNKEGDMKISYDIGQFNNASGKLDPQLQGLSLSMISTLSVLHYVHGTRYFNSSTILSDQNGANVTGTANRKISNIRFGSGSSLQDSVFQTDLSSIPYTIGGNTGTVYNATGQIIPVLAGSISFGRTTAAGNLTRQTSTTIAGGVFLYSVNFPMWSGQEVVHDPVFSTFITTTTTNNSPMTWIILSVAIGGVAAIVVIVLSMRARNKRSSSIPGSPGAAGEVNERAGMTRIALLNSLFFHYDIKDVKDRELQTLLDPYDPATFEFFAALSTITVHKMETAISNWSKLSWLNTDVEITVEAREIASILGSRLLLSDDKFDLQGDIGRAYFYRIENPTGAKIFLLDVFTRPSVNMIFRISLCSTLPLPNASMPLIEAALRRLSIDLQLLVIGNFKVDSIEQCIFKSLPVQLAMPRHTTPAEIVNFSRGIRLDDQLVPTDVAEIESDVKNMDDDMVRRVVNAFNDAGANLENETNETDIESEPER